MTNEEFIDFCKNAVRERVDDRFASESGTVPSFTVFVVWSCKTLQNSKAILSASIKGAPLFEITMNGDDKEVYVDTYIKESNEHLKI